METYLSPALHLQPQELHLILTDQAFPGEAEIAVIADDEVVEDLDLHQSPGENQVAGNIFISLAGFADTRRVIMGKDAEDSIVQARFRSLYQLHTRN